MSNPDTDTQEKPYDAVVNEALAAATTTEEGKLQFAEGTPEHVQFAARTVKRHRDTQSSFTKGQQRIKALEAENTELASSWEADAVSALSTEEKARLDELKFQDPEKWRTEITEIENTKREALTNKRKEISSKVNQQTEQERRVEVLNQFHTENPDLQITDEYIKNDVPPRITNKLANGEVSFEEFLSEVQAFATKGRVVAPVDAPAEEPDLGKARGGDAPSPEAMDQQASDDYKDMIL